MVKKVQNYIRIIAGTIVFTTALLSIIHNQYWLIATMFVGLNLFQYGFTNFCPMAIILKKIGIED